MPRPMKRPQEIDKGLHDEGPWAAPSTQGGRPLACGRPTRDCRRCACLPPSQRQPSTTGVWGSAKIAKGAWLDPPQIVGKDPLPRVRLDWLPEPSFNVVPPVLSFGAMNVFCLSRLQLRPRLFPAPAWWRNQGLDRQRFISLAGNWETKPDAISSSHPCIVTHTFCVTSGNRIQPSSRFGRAVCAAWAVRAIKKKSPIRYQICQCTCAMSDHGNSCRNKSKPILYSKQASRLACSFCATTVACGMVSVGPRSSV